MDLDSLYLLVTEAIERAEGLDDLGAPDARQAHLSVSLIEERIATLVPGSEIEGAVARRGAARHATAAGAYERAAELVARFLAEDAVGDELRRELTDLAASGDALIEARYPRVAARFGPAEIRRVAAAFYGQGMPFPVAG